MKAKGKITDHIDLAQRVASASPAFSTNEVISYDFTLCPASDRAG
jgi:hypothetical protein